MAEKIKDENENNTLTLTSIRLQPQSRDEAKQIADNLGIPLSTYIRMALMEKIREDKKKGLLN